MYWFWFPTRQSDSALKSKVNQQKSRTTCACFPVRGGGNMFTRSWRGMRVSRAWRWKHVYPLLARYACFPVRGGGNMFTRSWRGMRVFPCVAVETCLPALGAVCVFSRAWRWKHVYPLLARYACFPALSCIGYMLLPDWRRLNSFVSAS